MSARSILPIVLALCAGASIASAQPQMTQVTGPIYDLFGAPLNGTITFEWPSFQNSSGASVYGGTKTVSVVNGAVNVSLVSTALATTPVAINVTIHDRQSGTTQTEQWSIPAATSATLQTVRNMSYSGGTGLAPYALQIGTVTTLGAGSPVSATITGGSPVQYLNLSIPGGVGPQGNPGLTLTSFVVTRTSSTVLTLPNAATVTISDGNTPSSLGTALIYYPPGGPITIGLPSTINAVCSAGCVIARPVTQTPAGAILLYQWTAGSTAIGTWDATGTDLHAFFQVSQVSAGTGAVVSIVGNNYVVSADSTEIQLRTAAPTTVGSACTTGQYAFDSTYRWDCGAAGTWQRIAWGATVGSGSGPYLTHQQFPFSTAQSYGAALGPSITQFGGGVTANNGYPSGDDGWLTFSASSQGYVTFLYGLPSTWTGSITFNIQWGQNSTSTPSGNVQWNVQTSCTNHYFDATAPTYNAANTVTTAAPSQFAIATSSVTLTTTGCSAGQPMRIKVFNSLNGSGGTTFSGNPQALLATMDITQ